MKCKKCGRMIASYVWHEDKQQTLTGREMLWTVIGKRGAGMTLTTIQFGLDNYCYNHLKVKE